ncbi:reverse transcriptase domain-containing protein [Tanacetum coccineum]
MSNQTNELKNMMASFFQMNTASSSGLGPLPSNTIANPRGDLKAITTRSGISYDGPPIPPLPKVVEREPEVTKDTVQPSTKNIQPPVVQIQAPIDEPVVAPKPKLTARALIDVYGEELTLRVDDEAITFKVGQTSRYSYNDVVSINRIDIIDVACEEYAQEVLGFSDSFTSGNPTPSLDPILSTSSPSLIHFKEGDFIVEEIEACLINDSIPPGIDEDDFDLEGDPTPPPPPSTREVKYKRCSIHPPLPPKELHVEELKIIKSSIDDPLELELKDLPSHLEYAFLEGTDKLPVIIAKNLKEDEKVRLLKSWEDVKTKHFQPIHYASKTMTDAQAYYTTTEKELLAVVYDFEKFRPYLVLSKTIAYTDQSALKYLLAKQDAEPRLLWWILLLQEFDVIIRDKKGAENLAADHLSRLENPHQSDLEKKEIMKTFPLETLGMVTFRGDSKAVDILMACHNGPTGGHHGANYTAKKSLIRDFIGLLFIEMPVTWSHGVTLVNVQAKSLNVMKCLKIQFKCARSLTCGASISWDRSFLHEGTSRFSWPLTTCQNGLKQKRSPLMMPELW